MENIDKETRNMAELMVKFRIECTDIVAISDATNMPAKHTRYVCIDIKHKILLGKENFSLIRLYIPNNHLA